jgi:lysophospholipase L1-like esterase
VVTAAECFAEHFYPVQPDYDQYSPTIGNHCKGTNHQDITGVERVVFLGDSVTAGTPPTPAADFFRTVLGAQLSAKFPGVIIDDCSVWGARVDDLLSGDNQIANCFLGPEPLRTLVVMTLGGNDVIRWPQEGMTQAQAEADADNIAATFRQAIDWFHADPAQFPNGVFVTFASVYEFTDGTGELDTCPGAQLIGLTGQYLEGATALSYLEEKYMQIAVETGSDMMFMLEEFCGHGYRRDNSNSTCYVGPDAELWFDFTCIHPNAAGHHKIAEMFQTIIEE